MTFLRPTLAAAVLALGALVTPVASGSSLKVVTDCLGAGTNHAAVVVEHGDGSVVTACVAFASTTISGADLLRLSAIESATSSYAGLGDAVCQLDGEPATYPAGCWSASSPYWVVFVARGGGGWGISSVGLSSLSLADGDAEGFRYQPQTGAAQPPAAPGRCPTAAPTTRPAVRPTPTPRASATVRSTADASPVADASPAAAPATPPSASSASALSQVSGPSSVGPASAAAATSDPAASDASTGGIAAWLGLGAALVLLGAFAVAAAGRRSRGRGG